MVRVNGPFRVLNPRVCEMCPMNQIGKGAAVLKIASCVNGVEGTIKISPGDHVLMVSM